MEQMREYLEEPLDGKNRPWSMKKQKKIGEGR
jgi:hypothetical protein